MLSHRSTLLALFTLMLLSVALYQIEVRLNAVRAGLPKAEALAYLPRGEVLRVAALGYDALFADLLWLKVVQVMGEQRSEERQAEWVYQALDVTTTLDPKFAYVYELGSVYLGMLAARPDLAVRLLSKGATHNPESWRLHFFLGFNQFFFLGDFKQAADAMSTAATLPGRPDYVPLLAARLYTHAQEPELALVFLDRMYQLNKDERVRERLVARIREVTVARDLTVLNQAVALFHERHERHPRDLNELVSDGILPALPVEPFGGHYYYDRADGQVKSSTPTERLHVQLPQQRLGAPTHVR